MITVRFLSACGDDGENEADGLRSAVLYFSRYMSRFQEATTPPSTLM